MVQYYTLEQAAQVLRTTPDKLKEMAKKNEVRAFQDRGNLRFRVQEIDELARTRGLGSDPALPLGDAAKGGPASPSPRRKSKLPAQEPIAFIEDDEAPIGMDPVSSGKGGPSSSKNKGGPPSSGKSPRPASKLGPQTPSKLGPQTPSKLGPPSKSGRKPTQTSGAKSPPPKKASDSDVRLVADGSALDFQVAQDAPKSPAPGRGAPSDKSDGARKTRPSKLNRADAAPDSGVRIVPLDDASDSDVKITPDAGMSDSALAPPRSGTNLSDSDIRLEDSSRDVGAGKRSPGQNPITEEIDLDAEQARADAAARTQAGRRGRPRPNPLNLPTSSPFELSESDIEMEEPALGPKTPSPSSPADQSADTDSSSDFELTPMGEVDPTPLESSSSEQAALPAADDSDEVGLGELTGAGAAQSGINLQDPADSGISLEQGGSDEIEFELSLDSGATPKPATADADAEGSSDFELAVNSEDDSSAEEGESGDSSSEFELALDSAEVAAEGEEESSSEFELSLDDSGAAAATEEQEADSDSEFELTLDAEGGLEESGETDALAGDEGEKDIFETDFEVPALDDEESGSEAVAMEDEDTDLETSDFDLALDEEGASEEDSESGSQVVDLDDEEADEGAETEARPRRSRATAEDEDEEGELDLEIDPNAEPEEEEEEVAAGAGAVAPPPARWGPLPALLMLPSVIVLFVVSLLTFELVGTMWGYRQPGNTTGFGVVLHPIAKYFDSSLPD